MGVISCLLPATPARAESFMSLVVGEGANDWAVLPGVDGEGRLVEDGYRGDSVNDAWPIALLKPWV